MKKLLLILGVCLVAFSSCKKDDDKNVPQFMSGKKIERIYRKNDNINKYLSELWTWKDNGQLKSIDHYSSGGNISWTENFTFNDDNLVTEVEDYQNRERTEYKYDGTRLVRCVFFWHGNLEEDYKLNYEDGKLSSMEWTSYGKSGDERHLRAFSNILPDHIVKALAEVKVMNNSSRNSTGKLSFTWTGSNITKITSWYMGSSTSHEGTSEYEYDNKKNPFCEFYGVYMDLDFLNSNFSANNCISETYKDSDEIIVYRYSYEYDGDYPTEQRITYTRQDSGVEFEYYEYIN